MQLHAKLRHPDARRAEARPLPAALGRRGEAKVRRACLEHGFLPCSFTRNSGILTPDGRKIWLVQLDGGTLTTVEEGQFKEIKRQEP